MNKFGQYFTTNNILKQKIFEYILNNPINILEPCIGQGDLVSYITNKIQDITFDMYEIDNTIKLLDNIQKDNIKYSDFIKEDITKKYNTIIGNPPYIRTKKGNLYIDFTQKCYNLLDENGELIFIVPSDFLKLTSSSTLLSDMMSNGTFTHIFHPNDEKMFENASIDIIVFRYCKNKCIEKKVLYNNQLMYITNTNGLITFREQQMNKNNNALFKEYFDIYVGIVSGKEDVYKNEKLGNIEVLNGENIMNKYIYIESFPSDNEDINRYMLKYKNDLLLRQIRKFNDKNWFEWGAMRNINQIHKNKDKNCIYIYNITRKPQVAFLGKVNYFGGGLLMLIPKKECDLNEVVSFINSDKFKKNFIFSGRFKIGHRAISNSFFPI